MRLRRRHRERGVTLVEFALITPAIVLIFIGMFDLGRAIYYYNTVSHLAREGARRAAVLNHADGLEQPYNNAAWDDDGNARGTYTGTDEVVSGTVVDRMVDKAVSLDPSKLKITIEAPSHEPFSQQRVTVTVEYPYEPATKFLFEMFGEQALTLRASSEMIIQ